LCVDLLVKRKLDLLVGVWPLCKWALSWPIIEASPSSYLGSREKVRGDIVIPHCCGLLVV